LGIDDTDFEVLSSTIPEITDADMAFQAEETHANVEVGPFHKQYRLFHAAFAQFCYTGAQVRISTKAQLHTHTNQASRLPSQATSSTMSLKPVQTQAHLWQQSFLPVLKPRSPWDASPALDS
jgi:hypothetical protein